MPKFNRTICDIDEDSLDIAAEAGSVLLTSTGDGGGGQQASAALDFTPTQARRVAIAIQRAALVAEREEESK